MARRVLRETAVPLGASCLIQISTRNEAAVKGVGCGEGDVVL